MLVAGGQERTRKSRHVARGISLCRRSGSITACDGVSGYTARSALCFCRRVFGRVRVWPVMDLGDAGGGGSGVREERLLAVFYNCLRRCFWILGGVHVFSCSVLGLR